MNLINITVKVCSKWQKPTKHTKKQRKTRALTTSHSHLTIVFGDPYSNGGFDHHTDQGTFGELGDVFPRLRLRLSGDNSGSILRPLRGTPREQKCVSCGHYSSTLYIVKRECSLLLVLMNGEDLPRFFFFFFFFLFVFFWLSSSSSSCIFLLLCVYIIYIYISSYATWVDACRLHSGFWRWIVFLAVNHREPPSLFVKSCGLPKVAPQHNPIISHHQVMPVSAPASAGSLPGAHGFVDLSSDTRWKSCSPGSKREMSPNWSQFLQGDTLRFSLFHLQREKCPNNSEVGGDTRATWFVFWV